MQEPLSNFVKSKVQWKSLLIFLLFLFHLSVYSQIAGLDRQNTLSQELYLSRMMQLDFLLKQNTSTDSLFILLRQEAVYFAEQSDFENALDLIEQAVTLYQAALEKAKIGNDEPSSLTNPAIDIKQNSTNFNNPWQWTAELGTDYSRLEYELSYIESDSIVLDELNNFYMATRMTRNGLIKNNNYQLFGYLRADQNLFQSTLSLALESTNKSYYWRTEAQSDLYLQRTDSLGNFWDNQISFFWQKPIRNNNISLNSRIRIKDHFQSDSTYGDIYFSELNLSFRHKYNFLSWLEFTLRPSIYKETQILGLQYSQFQGEVNLMHRSDFNKFLHLQTRYQFRDFTSKQPDEDLKNRYQSLRPYIEGEIPIKSSISFFSRSDMEIRRYEKPDITYSNFFYGSFANQIKFYISSYNSIGMGYLFETEKHYPNTDAETSLVEQENYKADGFIFSTDLISFNGLMLSIVYQFTLRTYPKAGADDFLGIYSNRRIHSIQGFGYIPLTSHWQLQFLANYDNDHDRDRESNDNFSTILNLSIIYKF